MFLKGAVKAPFLLVKNEGRLGRNGDLGAGNCAKALLVDDAIAAHFGIGALGDGDLYGRLVGIEDDDDVTPVIPACIALQTEGNGGLGSLEELQMLPHKIGIAQTEGGMIFAQGDQVLVVVEDLRITRLVAPVELVDRVG